MNDDDADDKDDVHARRCCVLRDYCVDVEVGLVYKLLIMYDDEDDYDNDVMFCSHVDNA